MPPLYIRYGRRYRAATASDVLDAAAEVVVNREHGALIKAPRDAVEICRALCGGYEHERFAAVWLDARHRVIHAEVLFRGTIDGATVYPREVVKRALELNASAVVFTHAHPSGVAEPSESDRVITQQLAKALALFEIRVLDHVILGAERAVSFVERGLL